MWYYQEKYKERKVDKKDMHLNGVQGVGGSNPLVPTK
jgi:hypothetical protein